MISGSTEAVEPRGTSGQPLAASEEKEQGFSACLLVGDFENRDGVLPWTTWFLSASGNMCTCLNVP